MPVLTRPQRDADPVDLGELLGPHVNRLDAPGPLLVVVNDPQRHTDTAAVLRAFRQTGGGADRPWHILIACGTHGFPTGVRASFERALAEAAAPGATFTWHQCRDESMATMGSHHSWRANPQLAASDAPILTIGSVEPHYFAGLTGAHKTVTIGCAHRSAIEANHAGAMSAAAQPFALAGNPVFDGIAAMLAHLEAIRPVLAVNLLQVGPRICAAAVGEPLAALEQLQPGAREWFSFTLETPADALVLDVAGPLAGSFYQADKAIKNNEDAVRDGGLLILNAACPDGIGQDHFVDLLREAPAYASALAIVEDRGYRLGDHKAVRLRRLTDPAARSVRIAAVSEGLTDADCAVLAMTKAPSVAAALAAEGIRPNVDRVFTVPDAGNTVVRVAEGRDD